MSEGRMHGKTASGSRQGDKTAAGMRIGLGFECAVESCLQSGRPYPRRTGINHNRQEVPQTNRHFNSDQEVKMKLIVGLDRDEDGIWITECPSIPGCLPHVLGGVSVSQGSA